MLDTYRVFSDHDLLNDLAVTKLDFLGVSKGRDDFTTLENDRREKVNSLWSMHART